MAQNKSQAGISDKLKTIITVLLLFFFYPIGLLVMWFWIKWPRWLKILISIPFIVIFLLSIFVIIYLFYLKPFQMKGISMRPNYKDGAYLVTHVVKQNEFVSRGDVIIYNNSKNPDINYIKRVISLPGEQVMIKNGKVYINRTVLDESKYLGNNTSTIPYGFIKEGETVIIPQDEYFVLGDNREHSSDSRDTGFVPGSNIVSVVSGCYWNCN